MVKHWLLTWLVHNIGYKSHQKMRLLPLDSPERRLFNGSKIVQNRPLLTKLRTNLVWVPFCNNLVPQNIFTMGAEKTVFKKNCPKTLSYRTVFFNARVPINRSQQGLSTGTIPTMLTKLWTLKVNHDNDHGWNPSKFGSNFGAKEASLSHTSW